MKKFISVILAVLMLFSAVSVVAFAEGEEAPEEEVYCTIKFVDYDYSVIQESRVKKGDIVPAPANPTRESTEDCDYIFKGWSDDGGQTLYYRETIPIAKTNTTYVAIYSESEHVEVVTLWNFIASIFARINQIFEYFYNLFTRNLG